MSPLIRLLFTITVLFAAAPLQAGEITIQSGPARVHLLELFTSEGCSSCPPAERWFSTLRASPRLWKDFVPVAFHVDYWDALGWTDPLASKASTDRQRAYAASWGTKTVYTPGFVLNGLEWRGRDLESIPALRTQVGALTARIRESGEVEISFQPMTKSAAKLRAHAAVLGLGISSDVRAGENSGRKLIHDFSVVSQQSGEMTGADPHTILRLPADRLKHGKSALAVWITADGSNEPLQAAGGPW